MIPQKKSFNAYAVFTPSKHGRFFRFFNRPGFGHVYLIIPVYYPHTGLLSKQYALKVESLSWGMDIDFHWCSVDDLIANSPNITDVIRFRVNQPMIKKQAFRGALNCVCLTKAVCLVNNWKIQTPFHLWRWMRMNGGKSMKLTGTQA